MIKAIFFDLDGTLGGFGMGNGVFLEKVWGRLQEQFPSLEFGDKKEFLLAYRHLIGQCWGAWVKKELLLDREQVKSYIWEQLLNRYGIEGQAAQEMAVALNEEMLTEHPDDWRPAPGVLDVLKWAKEQGCVLAVLSNGTEDEQTGKLRDHGMLEFFDHLLFSAKVGYSKPDPRYFEHALSLVGCEPGEVLMIGDSYTHDIEAAEKLGMQRVWIFEDAPILGLPDERSVAKLSDVPALVG